MSTKAGLTRTAMRRAVKEKRDIDVDGKTIAYQDIAETLKAIDLRVNQGAPECGLSPKQGWHYELIAGHCVLVKN